jgi:hypothetical protein
VFVALRDQPGVPYQAQSSDFSVNQIRRSMPPAVPPREVSFARLSDLLAALPRLIVNNMARGVYLIGSKLAQRVRAVQIVDCAGNSTTLRLKDYISRKIEPEYKTLPWQQDVAVPLSANEKAEKVR